MQPVKKPVEKKIKTKEKPSEDKLKLPDEKLKKSTYNATTPRDYMLRSSAADIYAQRQKSAIQKAPKKVPGTSNDSKTSPMKDLLKSSPSSISQISNSSRISTSSRISSSSKTTNKLSQSNVKARTAKDLPFVNVTVNSPVAKRKLKLDTDAIHATKVKESSRTRNTKTEVSRPKDTTKHAEKEHRTLAHKKEVVDDRGDFDRQRSKTRTLDENEAKQLTPDKIDNNEEMMNLKQKLVAMPKTFYVDLDGDKADAKTEKTSDEDVSYEDDFESYESDFESYHSDKSNENTSEDTRHDDIEKDESEYGKHETDNTNLKEGKDEESMLDSGSFDLREQRSAKSKPAAMEFILETEEDKVSSLDEGFQEGSSAVSSMRTVHADALDRPMFIDFTKSKEKKLKKRIIDQMMQRAKDILAMVSLHEMSFTLFEMKPISYDLYMATFGRTNYMQVAVQTFEDGVTQEIQTDEVALDYKWTQFPVKFSKFDVHLNDTHVKRKNRIDNEDYLTKFSFIFDKKLTPEDSHDVDTLKEYKDNPLRVLLEQKDGVGNCEMMQYYTYKNKLDNSDFSMNKLGRFLKKVENKVSRVLQLNTNGVASENVMKSAFPFSSGYVGITTNNVSDEKSFLKHAKITGLILPEDKSNLILTVHGKAASGVVAGKCVVCMWDVSVARSDPIKILIAIDNVAIGRFRGSTDGIFVAALEDGSMHLWDLSEVPSWRNDVASSDKEKLVEIKTEEKITQTERDRVWNLKNSNAGFEQLPMPFALQACAYTSSAANMDSTDTAERTVGLEFVGDFRTQDGGRRIVGQICSLQRLGVLTIWTIVQEKSKTHDIGKAFWSKMKLEKTRTISLTDHISAKEVNDVNSIFNFNACKKRMLNRKQEKILARNFSRPKSTDSLNDRPTSARKLPVEKMVPHDWESGIVCSDLKIIQHDNTDRYLVAKNYGEVLSCTKNLGVFKVERLCVSSDTSSITCLEVSPHRSPYFLAATDSGTVHLYSLVDARVLLTLDCRNGPPADVIDRPQADIKGRFVSDPPRRHSHGGKETAIAARMSVSSVLWSRVNPCCIFTLSHEGALGVWELTHSDIYPKHTGGRATVACMANDGTLALITAEGTVQLHSISHQHGTKDYLELFHKYVAIL